MRILFIAPEPFFENRGTPIAVRNMLRVLGQLGHKTDLVTYYAGQDVAIPAAAIYRCCRLPFKRIPIGFSPLKLLLDPLTYAAVIKRLMVRRYDVVHCVEEGIFLGLLSVPRKGAVVCYDMDSSLTEQLTARGRLWGLLTPLLRALEGWAIRKSTCVATVCPALSGHVRKLVPEKPVFQIEDTPVVRQDTVSAEQEMELRERLSLHGRKAVVYIGNLETYQGIDLLLKAFALVIKQVPGCVLIIVGGTRKEVMAKRRFARALGLETSVTFSGFVPPERAGMFLSVADVLVSPRTRGTNFPMKVYSYLASGKPLVATDLPVHTQTLTPDIALLVPPTPEGIAQGIVRLLADPDLRRSVGEAGRRFVEREFTDESYRRKVTELYRWIAARAEQGRRGKVE